MMAQSLVAPSTRKWVINWRPQWIWPGQQETTAHASALLPNISWTKTPPSVWVNLHCFSRNHKLRAPVCVCIWTHKTPFQWVVMILHCPFMLPKMCIYTGNKLIREPKDKFNSWGQKGCVSFILQHLTKQSSCGLHHNLYISRKWLYLHSNYSKRTQCIPLSIVDQ